MTTKGLAGLPIVLDCEGVSRAVSRDAYLRGVIQAAYMANSRAVVSAATLVEAMHPRIDRAAFRWTVSRLLVAPVTRELAACASDLLAEAGRHGHQYALDAMVAATALGLVGHPTIYTSDPDDIRALVGKRATIVALR